MASHFYFRILKYNNKKYKVMKLFEGITKNGYFSELIKIEDFSTLDETVERINKHFLEEDDDCLFETKDEYGIKYNYCYISGDGGLYFVESLDEFSENRRSEEEWDVSFWKEII